MSVQETAASPTAADDAPAWLNASFIEHALRQSGEAKDIRVDSLTISRATAPGDNYASIIYRVKVSLQSQGEERERSLLVKTLPQGDALAKAVNESRLFHNESAMLSKYIPAMNELLKKSSSSHVSPFAACCLHHGATPSPFVVLEDLKPQGFVLADRRRGLGLRHSLMAIRTLARFHAASAALLAKNPSIHEDLPNFFKTKGRDLWVPFFQSSVGMAMDVCRKIPDFQEYVVWLENYKTVGLDVYSKLNDYSPEGFNVILHGDFWCNNMMFKYDENDQPEAFRMVDLQLSHVTSPAIDILYFLTTSLSDEVFENHERLLLREYHIALTEVLDLFGLRGPSFKEFIADLALHGSFSIFGAIAVWPIARAEEVPDINSSLKGDASNSAFMYENENTRRWFKRIFPKFKQSGWLDL